MKKIGFVDYYISEWHANNYPKWIKSICEQTGYEYELAYVWAEKDISPVDNRTTDEWCAAYGAEKCETVDELCRKSDVIFILAPSNEEKHLPYAEKVFPFGKPTYVDKTFAECYESGAAIFEIAKKYNTPFFSSSALRYSDAFDGYDDPVYFTAFNLAFLGRPAFKVVLWCVFALLGLFAAAAAAHAINRLAVKASRSTEHFLWGAFKFAVDAVFACAAAYLAVSGVAGWISGGMTWWWLMLHMVAGGALAAAVAVMAVLRHGDHTVCPCAMAGWTVWLILAAGTVFTAVMPMMSVFGSDGQLFLLWAHRLTGLAFVAVSCVLCFIAIRKRV